MSAFPLDAAMDPWKVAASLAAAVLVLAGVPQAVRIWRSRSARDVSLATWAMLASALGVLTVYVWFRVPDSILRVQYTLSTVVNVIILSGVLRFRRK